MIKHTALRILPVFLILLAGCASCPEAVPERQSAGFLGLVEAHPRAYTPPPPATFHVSVKETGVNQRLSGTQTKFLFGLFTLTGY